MILTFVTLAKDASSVPVWECSKDNNGNKFAFFVRTPAFSKRIMVLGPISSAYAVSEITEVQPNVFISKLELPYTDFCVAGDDLRPFVEHYNPGAPHINVVIFIMNRTDFSYLESATGLSARQSTVDDSVILNTFRTKEWMGCIAVIGNDFERGKNNPPRMVGMYIDYAINGESRTSMFREMQIKGNPKGISISDAPVEDTEISKKLLSIYRGAKKRSFRIQTPHRLSNCVVVPETDTDAEDIFRESPVTYIGNPFDMVIHKVPVDDDGNVIENDYVKNTLLPLF